MWNLRYLGKSKVLRGLVKGIFRLYFYDGRVIKIKRGPLRNLAWKCSSSQQFWMPLGIYEKETASWLSEELCDGDTFFDIGANFGYFTLLGALSVGDGGRVYSFEPIPNNCDIIQEMVGLNDFQNVSVQQVAVSDSKGAVEFVLEKTNANSHISSVEMSHAASSPIEVLTVQAFTLDEFCRENNVMPDVVKCDVEGAEVAVLSGAHKVLENRDSKWIISTHSKELEERCRRIMISYGYRVETLEGFHHELLCTPA